MKFKKTGMGFFLAIPDIISLLNLCFGFLAILLAFNNYVSLSAILIIVAIIFDSIDGWVARKIGRNDEYDFGKNIDSLADVVSFGLAPGILLYSIGSNYFQELSFLIAIASLFLVICGVLRLTRFNVIANKVDYDGFIGLPIPGTAILLSTFILSGFFNIYVALVLMIATGILMISNVKYPKFNNLKIISFAFLLILLIIIFYILNIKWINFLALILFFLSAAYAFINLIRKN